MVALAKAINLKEYMQFSKHDMFVHVCNTAGMNTELYVAIFEIRKRGSPDC